MRPGRGAVARRAARYAATAGLLAFSSLLAVHVGSGETDGSSSRSTPSALPPATQPFANPTRSALSEPDARTGAIRALLSRRAGAILADDRAAFLADIDPAQRTFARQQAALFTSLSAVSLSAAHYQLDPASGTAPTAPTRYGTANTWTVNVVLAYRLRGFDDSDATQHQVLTFTERNGRWLLASDADRNAAGDTSAPALWDEGKVVAVRGASSLVLGFAGNETMLQALSREVDQDIPRVSAVWTAAWPRRAVVVVPATQQQFAELTGVTGNIAQVEAVQSTELAGTGAVQRQSGNRITLNPVSFGQLSPPGRTVVLTHELTHTASRNVTSSTTPLWLVEGLADYVAFTGSGLPTHAVTSELRDLVTASGLPAALPVNAELSNQGAHVAASYEEAWLACRMVASTYGQAQLIRLYTLVGRSDQPTAVALEGALRTVTGKGTADFTMRWRAYVADAVRS